MMRGLNTRIERLEARLPPAESDGGDGADWLRDLCKDALAMIEAGQITDWTGKWADRCLSPTMAHAVAVQGADEERRRRVWATLHHMGELVQRFAVVTGWRSPSYPDAGWRSYRANSAAEMADCARAILADIGAD